ncbi:MAG: DNA alkylation repair protein [Bdellovibrionota bacterium]|nr:MAG: DNA alkylation repair protein [Bdellovibrionota bacterium]
MRKAFSQQTPSFKLPRAPNSITKGSSLRTLLDSDAINCLAHNISLVYPSFDKARFKRFAASGLADLELLQRGRHLSKALFEFLPKPYNKAVKVLIKSLTPPLTQTEQNGLGVFFYLPHVCFVREFGLNADMNAGKDPFEISMNAQYELTRRFSAEFSMRVFLINHQERTMKQLIAWTQDSCPHVRRLCSEGSRPRLPWATRIPNFIKDPTPCLQILECLKDDPEIYVRRSVANHLGDIAKDHKELALSVCESWLQGASDDRKWVIRHALRYLAKKNDRATLKLRALAA